MIRVPKPKSGTPKVYTKLNVHRLSYSCGSCYPAYPLTLGNHTFQYRSWKVGTQYSMEQYLSFRTGSPISEIFSDQKLDCGCNQTSDSEYWYLQIEATNNSCNYNVHMTSSLVCGLYDECKGVGTCTTSLCQCVLGYGDLDCSERSLFFDFV